MSKLGYLMIFLFVTYLITGLFVSTDDITDTRHSAAILSSVIFFNVRAQ